MKFNEYCLSSYLALRYVAAPDEEWINGISPKFPAKVLQEQEFIEKDKKSINSKLEAIVNQSAGNKPAIFLSGGIDSAIIASYLPKNTKAYCIKFVADGAIDESKIAQKYADYLGIDLSVVEVTWEDYHTYMVPLMKNKKAPLHPIEVGLYKAAKQANDDGCTEIFVGNGADSTFGGMDKLLSKDWEFDAFYDRYTFIEPSSVLKNFSDLKRLVYHKYKTANGKIDFIKFLKEVHGLGIVQTFNNAIEITGLKISAPYEKLKLKEPFDLSRVRRGQPKYLLYEIFEEIYPNFEKPRKIPFARPTDTWLKSYQGPEHYSFLDYLNMSDFTGEQKFLLLSLDIFLFMIEDGKV